uniref:Macrophage migration inhibitory factor n=1 Tax=Heterorhabditis bacteriophora TaxID=37862 RepID=A0A1I7X061_HETBA
MTIVAQLSTGRVLQQEGQRNGERLVVPERNLSCAAFPTPGILFLPGTSQLHKYGYPCSFFQLLLRNQIYLYKKRVQMPMVRLVTNIPNNIIPENLERILVEITSGARVIHGVSNDPVVYITITSIGAVSGEDNIRHTRNITKFCEEELNISENKLSTFYFQVIIAFHDASPTEIGFCGTTVANQLD